MSIISGLVSVVIPYFNSAKQIRKCVESVLAQTYSKLEIIVVDDGSDDDVFSSLADIDDFRLKKPFRIQHSGVSAARNVGIIQAAGEYIIFIDADDWIEPNHVEVLLKGLDIADLAMIEMIIDYPDKSEISPQTHDLFMSHKILDLKDYNLLFESYLLSSPCNKIYRTKYLKEIDFLYFEKGISYAEDLLFNLEYLQRIKSVALMPFITYHYVKNPTSATKRYHRNTTYTIRCIISSARHLFVKVSVETERIFMELMLWGLYNIHHPNTDMTSREQIAAIKYLLSIPEIRVARSHALQRTKISNKYKILLAIDSPWLIHKVVKFMLKRK